MAMEQTLDTPIATQDHDILKIVRCDVIEGQMDVKLEIGHYDDGKWILGQALRYVITGQDYSDIIKVESGEGVTMDEKIKAGIFAYVAAKGYPSS